MSASAIQTCRRGAAELPVSGGNATAEPAVALLSTLMHQSNNAGSGTSVSRLTTDLRALVAAGRPGDALPSARELVARYRVSPVTVTRALHTLVAEGLVQTRPGHGTFVAAR